MIELTLMSAIVILTICIVVGLLTLLKGPSSLERILALDAIAVWVVALMAILSLIWSENEFLEVILLFSILGFLSTTTVVLYLTKTLKREKEMKS